MTAARSTLPSVTDVVAEFRRALREPGAAVAAMASSDSCSGSTTTTSCSGTARTPRAATTPTTRAVAAAKRDIDALNRSDTSSSRPIDAALAAGIEQAPAAPPTTESPAMVFDRLSVLVIRISFTESAASSPREDRDQLRGARAGAARAAALLQAGLEALFDDVRTGRRRFVPYQSLKLYGSAPDPRGAGSRPD